MNQQHHHLKKYRINNVAPIVTTKGTTIEWCKGISGKQVTIYYRKKGSTFADHFHTGSDGSKNPEMFFLVQGKVEFDFFDIFQQKQEKVIINAGDELLIYPYLYHKAKALEDSIFLEYRTQEFNIQHDDIHSWDEYQVLTKSPD